MEGKILAGVVTLVGATVIAAGTALLYAGGAPPPPERPRPPPPPETLMNSQLKYSPALYRGMLEEDARKFGVAAPSAGDLAQPLEHADELGPAGRRRMKVGETVDTARLRLTLALSKQKATLEGQLYATEHLVLRIQNKGDRYLAYRVETTLPDAKKCALKGDLPHNAIVIGPRQTIERTECLYRGARAVELLRAEVMELTALGAHYVSRLPATSTLYDPRTAAGHVPLKGELCPQTFSWREIREGIDQKRFGWRDIIDFYARHSCEEYSFFKEYRYRKDARAPLPARPPE